MKIQVTAELNGKEVVQDIIDKLSSNTIKVDAKSDDIKAMVFSTTKDSWVEVKPELVKFVFNK